MLEHAVQQDDASGKLARGHGDQGTLLVQTSWQWLRRTHAGQCAVAVCAARETRQTHPALVTEAAAAQARAGGAELIASAWCHSWLAQASLGPLPPWRAAQRSRAVGQCALSSAPGRDGPTLPCAATCRTLHMDKSAKVRKLPRVRKLPQARLASAASLARRLTFEVARFHLGAAPSPKSTLARARPHNAHYVRTLPSRPSRHQPAARWPASQIRRLLPRSGDGVEHTSAVCPLQSLSCAPARWTRAAEPAAARVPSTQ